MLFIQTEGVSAKKEKEKNLKVVERICAGQLCVELEGLVLMSSLPIYSNQPVLNPIHSRIRTPSHDPTLSRPFLFLLGL